MQRVLNTLCSASEVPLRIYGKAPRSDSCMEEDSVVLRLNDREQREAFHTIPSARIHSENRHTISTGRGPDHSGGVQSRSVNGTGQTKRTHDGVPVKRE